VANAGDGDGSVELTLYGNCVVRPTLAHRCHEEAHNGR
jgi:hypothetical protein